MDQFRLLFTGVPFEVDHPVFPYLRERKVSFEYAKNAEVAIDSLFSVPVDVLVIGIDEFELHSVKLDHYKQQFPASMLLVYFSSIQSMKRITSLSVEGTLFEETLFSQLELYLKQHMFVKRMMEIIHKQQETLNEQRQTLDVLNKRIESWVNELEDDFTLVNTIQKALIPARFPQLKALFFQGYFRPGYERGGDFFDVFSVKDRSEIGFVQLDSVGHSVIAGLLSALLKVAVSLEGTAKPSFFESVFESIRSVLMPVMTVIRMSIKIRLGWIDPKKLLIEVADFGVGPCFHFHAERGEIETLQLPSNPPFDGALTLPMIHRQFIQLSAGDCLWLPSDGCKDVFEPMKEILSKKAAAPILELRNELAYHLRDPEAKAQDDASFLLIQVAQGALKLIN